jgi:hypothetical protein
MDKAVFERNENRMLMIVVAFGPSVSAWSNVRGGVPGL